MFASLLALKSLVLQSPGSCHRIEFKSEKATPTFYKSRQSFREDLSHDVKAALVWRSSQLTLSCHVAFTGSGDP
ncbi:hypothetical protein INR49_026345 [Caranx melampygus]|nr:hypothetical protein INR49_026345 [Caranx melampygus]